MRRASSADLEAPRVKLVTWNVNSIKARADYVSLFLDAEAPDVLAVQELKVDGPNIPLALFEARGYHVAFHAQPRWNGVLIASRLGPIEAVHRGLEGADEGEARLVSGVTGGLRIVNLYCPQGQRVDSPKFPFKLRFFDGLRTWLEQTLDGSPTVVIGDLNIAPGPDDIWAPERFADVPSYHPEEHARWDRLLALGLSDVVRPHVPPKTYSFWDYRGGAFHREHGMRIDHVLANAAAADRVEGAWVARDWRKKKDGLTPSDHAPVVVQLRGA